eukprot:TRINITY_DN12745_c0_g1_i1.p1 TRINITY_DN12745_c0_g1~~TRINITY_DN12745_c0_g1_i1.p1  ORF type:complete len:571 (+),score=51.72 TRINITY_DN12745_c0_g1_i1:73-1713(+)
MILPTPGHYGGYGASGSDIAWRKLSALQGQFREWQARARKAEADLEREVVRHKRANAALAAERRKSARLQREAHDAAERAEAALARCHLLVATLAAGPPHPLGSVPTPPRPLLEGRGTTTARSPRAQGALLALPESPRARLQSRGTTTGESPRSRGVLLALPDARGALLALPDPSVLESTMTAAIPLMSTGTMTEESPRARGALLALPDAQEGRDTMTAKSPRARAVLLALPDSPRALESKGTMTAVHPLSSRGTMTGASPRARGALLALPDAQVGFDADSPQRRDVAAAAAVPRTPPQSPERSDVNLTPGPSSPRGGKEGTAGSPSDLPATDEQQVKATASDNPEDVGVLRLDGGDSAVTLSSTPLLSPDTPDATGPRPPSQAGTVLEIDHVAHWVALFVRRDWAPVSSAAARSVAGVVNAERDIWWSAFVSIGQFQSVGFEHAVDTKWFGPEFGPLRTARQDFDQLAEDVLALATPRCMRWFNRWRVRLLLTANMYEEMRLRHRELYGAAREVIGDLNGVLDSLEAALEMYDRRVSEEAVGEAG